MVEEVPKIIGKLQSLMDLALKLDRAPKKFGTDRNLSHSEIHLVEIIGDNHNLSVTGIARLVGITKGAVSQALKRLEKKGIVQKQAAPENLSRAIVSLTAKGMMAYWAHKHWHETMDGGFGRYLGILDKKEAGIIVDFINRMEDFLTRRLESPE